MAKVTDVVGLYPRPPDIAKPRDSVRGLVIEEPDGMAEFVADSVVDLPEAAEVGDPEGRALNRRVEIRYGS